MPPAPSPRLTAIVLARDSAPTLPRCLESLRFADEVVVVDDGSVDRTRELAAALGARVVARRLDRFDTQRNWAQEQARSPWVLFIDSDEQVPEGLAREIREQVAGNAGCAAFAIPRRNYFLGRRMRGSGWASDQVVRLLRRDAARWEGAVHERPRVAGRVGRLTTPLEHHPYPTLAAYWDKLEIYARLGVGEIWFWRQDRIEVYCLREGRHEPSERSGIFPHLDVALLASFLDRPTVLQAVRAFRDALTSSGRS